jgi:uncharacterized protein (DUF305 family)
MPIVRVRGEQTMSITRRSTRAVGGGALVLSLALTLSACGASAAPAGDAPPAAAADAGAQHNEADIGFVQTMVPHHQQALDMAEIAHERTQSTEVRALAEQIQSVHDPQLATLTGFLESWGVAPADDGMAGMGGMDHSGMSGMADQGDMDALAGASGPAFDAMFLEMMIAHHEGAVADAERAVTEVANPQVKELATQIVSDQTAEIQQIRQLLQQ